MISIEAKNSRGDMHDCKFDISTCASDFSFDLIISQLREHFTHPFNADVFDRRLRCSCNICLRLLSNSSFSNTILSYQASSLVWRNICSSTSLTVNVPECKLDSREPVSHAVPNTLEESRLLGTLVSFAEVQKGLPFICIHATNRHSNIRILLLSVCTSISATSSIVASIRKLYLLSTHWAVLAAALNKLDDAELVEDVATLQLSSRYKLVLTDGAVF